MKLKNVVMRVANAFGASTLPNDFIVACEEIPLTKANSKNIGSISIRLTTPKEVEALQYIAIYAMEEEEY